MSTYARTSTDRWVQRAIIIAAGLLALCVLALGGLYIRDRNTQSGTSAIDRQLEDAKALVRSDPENLAARITLANAYLTKEMYRDALEQFREALKADESNQGLMLGAGIAALRSKQDDETIKYFQQVADLNKDADFLTGNRQLNAVYYELGRLYLSKGDADKAEEILKEALRADRTDSDSLLLLGQALAAKGELDKAFDAYRFAAAYVPDFADAYLGMAQVAEMKGDAARAAYGRAMVAFSTGKADDAVKALEAVVPQLPDFADAPFGLGMAYERKGDKSKALEAYKKVVDINPQHRMAQQMIERLSK